MGNRERHAKDGDAVDVDVPGCNTTPEEGPDSVYPARPLTFGWQRPTGESAQRTERQ